MLFEYVKSGNWPDASYLPIPKFDYLTAFPPPMTTARFRKTLESREGHNLTVDAYVSYIRRSPRLVVFTRAGLILIFLWFFALSSCLYQWSHQRFRINATASYLTDCVATADWHLVLE